MAVGFVGVQAAVATLDELWKRTWARLRSFVWIGHFDWGFDLQFRRGRGHGPGGRGGVDSRFRAQLEPDVRARTTKLIGGVPEAAHSPLVEFTKGNGIYCYWPLYRPLATLRLRRGGEHDCSLRGLRVGREDRARDPSLRLRWHTAPKYLG
jgi:hypothetical protein